jgi:hypothetical protein
MESLTQFELCLFSSASYQGHKSPADKAWENKQNNDPLDRSLAHQKDPEKVKDI